MSDVLAKIRVREMHGIRRFLYPLTAEVSLGRDILHQSLCLNSKDGAPVFLQVTPLQNDKAHLCRLDFAVSLAPHSDELLTLVSLGHSPRYEDLLHISRASNGSIRSTQKKFSISIDSNANISEVIYHGLSHLRGPTEVLCNQNALSSVTIPLTEPVQEEESGFLSHTVRSRGHFPDNNDAQATLSTRISACKSWAFMDYQAAGAQPGDTLIVRLPLAVTSSLLCCDFGVGGGVYGKLQQGSADKIVWHTDFSPSGTVQWTWATDGRVDFIGEVESAETYRAQRWFHLIDSDKTLAAAITHVPDGCESITVTLKYSGDVEIAFRLGPIPRSGISFGVCWHFLNDVPAIAAATNPQSILLPPHVEVCSASTLSDGSAPGS